MKRTISVVAATLFVTSFLWGGENIEEHLNTTIHALGPNDKILVWVFFADKGRYEAAKTSIPHSFVSERSLLRRQKVRQSHELLDYTDLPVEQSYIDDLRMLGVQIRHRSKWFNCVSVNASRTQIDQIETISFVEKIELVWRGRRRVEPLDEPEDSPATSPTSHVNKVFDFDYGLSLSQVQLINVPAVHNAGNYGQGVLVGVFDNGFRLLNHEAFNSLRSRIIATYDFVDHKVSVAPNDSNPGFGAHGIVTLSTLAGYKPGQLIGPAFGASFILARTENDSSETPIEEDNWVAAIEWADSIGVDVTSTSLGYLDYGPPYTSWTWQNMDGNTTLITRAADMAVAKGIVVVNSAGNNGFNPSRNTLNAPADGDSVIAVGAVSSNGTRASFSSVGPTTSIPPRIKPDVMAQGTAVRCASATDTVEYIYNQGTSLACPLVAGVVALMLHAKPNATPMQIADALRSTASQPSTPDNQMGWGIINAAGAISYITGGPPFPTSFTLRNNYPNPFPTPTNPSTTIGFSLSEASQVTITIHNTLGQKVLTLVNDQRTSGAFNIPWDATNAKGIPVASGVYFCVLEGVSISGKSFFQTAKLVVLR
ncbi:MAG: Subtilisin-like serine protease [Bacteroidetes bacterium]|nr:Subtilisin-like serine protease [Bacteroidota bacterium]